MSQNSTFSIKNVVATIAGTPVVGLFDGDNAIEVAPNADVGSLLVGAAGDTVFSASADRSALITLRLFHTSPTHTLLTGKWRLQREGRVLAFPFSVIDTVSKEGGVASSCYLTAAPTAAFGKMATVREWRIAAANWEPSVPINVNL